VYILNTSEGGLLSDNATSWKGILLLSIMLPVGLFTSLKLAGIAPTAKPETITLAPVAWQFNRTVAEFTIINHTLNATYTDNAGRMSFSVTLYQYSSPDIAIPAYSLDFGINFTATLLNGDFSVRSVLVTIGKDVQPSLINLQEVYISFENLTLRALCVGGEQAGVLLLGNNTQGSGCRFSVVAYWYIPTPNNVTNQRQVDFEITYFNGTAYKRIIQLFDLTLVGS
jgi:hypothetical protein